MILGDGATSLALDAKRRVYTCRCRSSLLNLDHRLGITLHYMCAKGHMMDFVHSSDTSPQIFCGLLLTKLQKNYKVVVLIPCDSFVSQRGSELI